MTCSAARVRARLLTAAPAMVLGSLCWHAGGAAAALLLWLGMSFLQPCRERYPYPRKRGIHLHRLFFCFALTAFLTGGAGWMIRWVLSSSVSSRFFELLIDTGAVGFALPIGKKALSLPLSPKLSWGLGALLCAFFLVFLILQTPRI